MKMLSLAASLIFAASGAVAASAVDCDVRGPKLEDALQKTAREGRAYEMPDGPDFPGHGYLKMILHESQTRPGWNDLLGVGAPELGGGSPREITDANGDVIGFEAQPGGLASDEVVVLSWSVVSGEGLMTIISGKLIRTDGRVAGVRVSRRFKASYVIRSDGGQWHRRNAGSPDGELDPAVCSEFLDAVGRF